MILSYLLFWLAGVIIAYAFMYDPKPITMQEMHKLHLKQKILRTEFEKSKSVIENLIKDVLILKNQKPKTIEVNINGN